VALRGVVDAPDWDNATDLSDYGLRLTSAESENLRREVQEVIGRYRRDEPGEPSPDGAELVILQMTLMPFLDRP
jgi:hypothetical protein